MPTPQKRVARSIPRQQDDEDEVEEATTATDNGDEEEEEEESTVVTPRRGWSAGQQTQESTSSFAQAFRVTEQQQVVKFLEDEPYVNYTRHWIERQTPTGRSPRSYTCLKTFGKNCPLCEAGDKAQAVSAFNIALIGDDGVPILKSWDCGPKLFGILKGYAADPKVAPLTKGYYLVSRSGKQGTYNHNVRPVTARGLEEDLEITPPSAEEVIKIGLWDENIVPMPKTSDLEAIAAEIADEY